MKMIAPRTVLLLISSLFVIIVTMQPARGGNVPAADRTQYEAYPEALVAGQVQIGENRESPAADSPAAAGTGGAMPKAVPELKKKQPAYFLHLAATLSAISPENEAYAMQLVKKGADVNRRDEIGRTPLHILCSSCLSPALAQVLVDAGADVNMKTTEGHTPLDLVRMMQQSGQRASCGAVRDILQRAGAR